MDASPDLAVDFVRLYLSPLTPALLPTYLPGNFQQRAKDITYHSIETFPERPFGFITLPSMDAKKIKSKLSGAILKGSKVRIEEARPAKRKIEDVETADTGNDSGAEAKKKAKKEKKKKKEKKEGVLAGVELEDGRSVKRGWTEVPEYKTKKDKKTKEEKKARKAEKTKSKYTKEPEVLFKTKLPPNKVENITTEETKKDKKKKKKSKQSTREVVVHEFEKTKKHASFLKAPAAANIKHDAATEFVDGQGWVDPDGVVVEKLKPARESRTKKKQESYTPTKDSKIKNASKKKAPSPTPSSSDISSSDSSSDSSDSSSEDSDEVIASPAAEGKADITQDDIKKKPNPLELLFKRPAGEKEKRPTPIDTSFNFFPSASEADDQPSEMINDGPQTPFTKHVESRGWPRSGAPTPDTAAVHRRFSFNRGVVDENEDSGPFPNRNLELHDANEGNEALSPVDEDADESNGVAANGALASSGDKEESLFAKWFWENRGDNNRTWKRRRKEAMKEKRQRDTRRLGRRIV